MRRGAFRVIAGLTLLRLGYEVGRVDGKDTDYEKSQVVDFECEEQIYDELINKKKMAVFLFYFVPGPRLMHLFNDVFERESHKYTLRYRREQDPEFEGDASEDVVFMRVHCRKHLNFVMNRMWAGR